MQYTVRFSCTDTSVLLTFLNDYDCWCRLMTSVGGTAVCLYVNVNVAWYASCCACDICVQLAWWRVRLVWWYVRLVWWRVQLSKVSGMSFVACGSAHHKQRRCAGDGRVACGSAQPLQGSCVQWWGSKFMTVERELHGQLLLALSMCCVSTTTSVERWMWWGEVPVHRGQRPVLWCDGVVLFY